MEEEMKDCGHEGAEEGHCPYAEDIWDIISPCKCCGECYQECCADI